MNARKLIEKYMNAQKLFDEINRIFGIVFVQKAFRLILRSAWMSGAVYLAFWGMNQVWGVFPNSTIWTIFSLLTGLVVLGSLFLRRQPDKAFVWRLDQRFGLKEQVYTAYELYIGKKIPEHAEDEDSIPSLLAEDAAASLPAIRKRVVNRGWNLRPEFESALVVLILLLVVYLNSVSLVTQLPPGGLIGILPGLGSDPDAEEIFSSGAGDGSGSEGQGQSGEGQQDVGGDNPFDLTEDDYKAISQILGDLGEELDQDATASQLGQALKEEDYSGAAEEFGRLAEAISQVSGETREGIADKFLNTAVELQQAGQPSVSAYFQQSADALYGESFSAMSESLDALGGVMQVMAQFKEDQVIVDQQDEDTSATPVDRIESEGLALEISGVEGFDNLVSVPGNGGEEFGGAGNGDDPFVVPSDVIVEESIWQSYDLSLDDVDVVSSYFSSR